MAKGLVVGVLVAVAFTVYGVVDCALTERSRVRGLPRWTWILLQVLVPVIGGALWFLIGRGRGAAPAARITGPDDDPAFLRASGRRHAAAPALDDAEWRRFEQELANLDSDADDEGDQTRR